MTSWILWMTPPRTSSMRFSSNETMIAVTLGVVGDQVAAQQPVAERAIPYTRCRRRVESFGHQRVDLDAAGVLGTGLGQRRHDVGCREAHHPVDRVDPLDPRVTVRMISRPSGEKIVSPSSATMSVRVPPNSFRKRSYST